MRRSAKFNRRRKERKSVQFPHSKTSYMMDGTPGQAGTATQQGSGTDQPLRPARFLNTSAEVDAEMNGVYSMLEVMVGQAREQNRALTNEEQSTYDRQKEYFEWLRDTEMPRVQSFESMARDRARQLPSHPGIGAQQAMGGAGGNVPAVHQETRRRPRITRRLRTFRPELFNNDTGEAYMAAEQAGHWLRAYLYNHGTSEIRDSIVRPMESVAFCKDHEELQFVRVEDGSERMAQVVETPTLGGYLVPEVVLATVIDVRDRHGLAPNICRRYPMASETDLIPKRDAGLTVEKPGENTEITKSTKTWAQLRLAAVDAYTLTAISAKLMRGAVVDAAEEVISEIGWAFAKQLDYEMIAADGTAGKPNFGKTGLINAVAAGGEVIGSGGGTGWGSIAATDLDKLVGLLPDRFDNQDNGALSEDWAADTVPRWLMPRALYYEFIEPLMEARGASKADMAGRTPRLFRGYPVHFSEWMPRDRTALDTVAIAFGNFYEGFQLGERQVVTVAVSEHNQFEFDNIVIKGKSAWDLNFHEPGDALNAGAIVVLKTAPT